MRLQILVMCSFFIFYGCKEDSEDPINQSDPPISQNHNASSPPAQERTVPEAQTTLTPPNPALLTPPAQDEHAPDLFKVALNTTKGRIELEVHRDWAPKGADRFYTLVKRGYFNDVAFFRVISGFMAQVGLHGHPDVNTAWRSARIEDDPVTQSNTRGRVSFATSGPNSRTTQFFISFGDNSQLDGQGFSPFAEVKDMSVVDRLHAGYGEGAPRGQGPSQGLIQTQGNPYLQSQFPQLDYIRSAEIIP